MFGLLVSSVAVFIFFFTISYLDYIKSVQGNKYIDYDIKTLTAGDYTVEFELSPTLFQNWQENFHDVHSPMSEMAQFKHYIWREMETRVNLMEHLGYT